MQARSPRVRPEREGTDRVLLLASATETGPLRAVLASLPPGAVTIIYQADPGGADVRRDLHAAAGARGARAYYLPGNGEPDPGPLSPPQVQALIPVLRAHDVYVSGPPGLAAATVTALRAAGISRRRICVAG